LKKFGAFPLQPIAFFLGIVILVRLVSRHPSMFSFLPPDVLAAILFLYSPIFYYRSRKPPSWIAVTDTGKSAGTLLLAAAAGVIAYLVYMHLPVPPSIAPYKGPIPSPADLLFREGLLAALPEEVFFRGYLHDAFEEKGWEPVVPTSVLFAAGHLLIFASWYRALTFFPGLLLGWSRKASGNIYVPVLLHLLFNLLPYSTGGLQ
jgi:membrane protease YdiL (CAAX protease family)